MSGTEPVAWGLAGRFAAAETVPSPCRLCSDSLGEVRVWCLEDLRPAAIRRLHPLTGGILSLRLFKSGGQQLLGTQGRDGTTLLWGCDQDLRLSE